MASRQRYKLCRVEPHTVNVHVFDSKHEDMDADCRDTGPARPSFVVGDALGPLLQSARFSRCTTTHRDELPRQLSAVTRRKFAARESSKEGRRKIEFESGPEDFDISQRTVFRFHALLPSAQVQGRYDTSPRPRHFVFFH